MCYICKKKHKQMKFKIFSNCDKNALEAEIEEFIISDEVDKYILHFSTTTILGVELYSVLIEYLN